MKNQITLLLSLGTVLTAQVAPGHDVPLKNWAAPLYWQPSQAASEPGRESPHVKTPHPDAAIPVGALENPDSREFRTVTQGVMHESGGATRDVIPFEGKESCQPDV